MLLNKKTIAILILIASSFLITNRWHFNFFKEQTVQRVNDKNTNPTSKELQIYFLDVGQGDAILIKTPMGKQILLDGGEGQTVLEKLGQYLPLTDKTIELVILSHPHGDHLGGLIDVLERYQVEEVWLTGVVHTSSGYLEFLNLINSKKITAKNIFACGENKPTGCSDEIAVENNMKFKVLWPRENLTGQRVKEINNISMVLKLIYGNNSWLLPGDLDSAAEEKLIRDSPEYLMANVLKVAHHGSSSATSEEWLKLVSPTDAIISVGKDNDYGHPSLRILNRLKRVGINIWRTDELGDTLTESDGITINITSP